MLRTSGRAGLVLWGLCFILVAAGCYEQKQAAVINPDGSGRVVIETRAAVPAVTVPGKGKPTAEEFGRQLAKDFINKTQGVEGWKDLTIRGTREGDALVTATAYFPDIRKLRFSLPLVFTWQRQENGTYRFGMERERGPGTPEPLKITDAQLKEQVGKAQASYREQRPALQTALSTFKLTLAITLPGEVFETKVLTQGTGEQAQTVTIAIEGNKLVAALDKFMADEATMGTTIASGNDLMSNDDLLLESMFGQKGPVSAGVRVNGAPAFNYPLEAKAALAQEPEMLKAAGVELVPKFIVKPATRPR
jgi:hypothetical protein